MGLPPCLLLLLGLAAIAPARALAAAADLQTVDGRSVKVADLHRRGPAVLWFTNLCPNCQGGFPGMDSVVKAAAGTHATVTAVSFIRNDRDRVAALLKERAPAFPIVLDPAGAATKQYTGAKPANACPLVNLVILDRKGAVIYRGHYPGVTPGELVRRLREAAPAR